MWGPEDTVGLLSCILGTAWVIVGPLLGIFLGGPTAGSKAFTIYLLYLIGGIAFLIMGIAAVANDSKIGIGGIIFGVLYTLSGLFVFFIPSF